MSPEIKKDTLNPQQICFEFIDSLMSRDFNEGEIFGLQKLIKKYGAAEIQGQAVDLLLETEQSISGEAKIDLYLKEFSSVYPTVDKWIGRRIERQSRTKDETSEAAKRVKREILNSPNGQPAEGIESSVRFVDELSKN